MFGSKKLPDPARALGRSMRILMAEATKDDAGRPERGTAPPSRTARRTPREPPSRTAR
ncbi:twin-arginine translocase TatA/TatE family subunit [Streptomyces sp. SLBN-115]|uniref:twin-arginine translocase TatA/TatE family subunit n=1 Tax=Streptomyces sp. SLBN-115 TaxID=2768453 RepID=UPI00114DA2E8|nr:twin-arginine translocase TatA/TatE family subunit [Streptomyces sp. SLBN-115]